MRRKDYSLTLALLADDVWMQLIVLYRQKYSRYFETFQSPLLKTPRIPSFPLLNNNNNTNIVDNSLESRLSIDNNNRGDGVSRPPSSHPWDRIRSFNQFQQFFNYLFQQIDSSSQSLPLPFSSSSSTKGVTVLPSPLHQLKKTLLAVKQAERLSSISEDEEEREQQFHPSRVTSMRILRISDFLPSEQQQQQSLQTTSIAFQQQNKNPFSAVAPSFKMVKSAPLLSDPLLLRHFRNHFIPLQHDKIKYLLSLSSEDIVTSLIQQIEEIRLEIDRQNQQQQSTSVVPPQEEMNSFLENDQLTILAKSFLPPLLSGGGPAAASSSSSRRASRETSRNNSPRQKPLKSAPSTTTGTTVILSPSSSSQNNSSSGTSFLFPKAIQVETNLSFLLPPFDFTYQLFYSVYHLKESLFNPNHQIVFVKIFQKWIDLLDVQSFNHVNKVLMKSNQWNGSSYKVFFGSEGKSYFSREESTSSSSSAASGHDIRRYLQIISDLVTFFFVLKSNCLKYFRVIENGSYPSQISGSGSSSSCSSHSQLSTTGTASTTTSAQSIIFPSNVLLASNPRSSSSSSSSSASHEQDALKETTQRFAYLPFQLSSLSLSLQENEAKAEDDDQSPSDSSLDETMSEFLHKYALLTNLDLILSLVIRREWSSCVNTIMDQSVEFLGINCEEITAKQQQMAVARSHQQQKEKQEKSGPFDDNNGFISPKKNVKKGKERDEENRSSTSSMLGLGGLFQIKNPSLFSTPPSNNNNNNNSGSLQNKSSAKVFNQKMQKTVEELIFSCSTNSSSHSSTVTGGKNSSSATNNPLYWLHRYQQFIASKQFFFHEKRLTLFVTILSLLMESNSWLSLELIVNHFFPFISPFLVKCLLFERTSSVISFRKRRPDQEGTNNKKDYLILIEENNDFSLILFYFDYLTKIIRNHYNNTNNNQKDDQSEDEKDPLTSFSGSFMLNEDDEIDLAVSSGTKTRSNRRRKEKRRLLVNEWLELSLLLSHGRPVAYSEESLGYSTTNRNHKNDDNYNNNYHPHRHHLPSSSSLSTSQFGWRKTASVCSKSIVNSDRNLYKLDCADAMQSALLFEECEAILQVFQKYLNNLKETDSEIIIPPTNKREEETEEGTALDSQNNHKNEEEKEDEEEEMFSVLQSALQILLERLLSWHKTHSRRVNNDNNLSQSAETEKQIEYYRNLVRRYYLMIFNYISPEFSGSSAATMIASGHQIKNSTGSAGEKRGKDHAMSLMETDERTFFRSDEWIEFGLRQLIIRPINEVLQATQRREGQESSAYREWTGFLADLFFSSILCRETPLSMRMKSFILSRLSPEFMKHLPFDYFLALKQFSA
jgi:ribosomal protein L12E/L44/L45/RPP1/RPP2